MSKIKAPFVAAIGALILVGILFLSFVLSSSAYRTDGSGIVLPSALDPSPVGVEDWEQKNEDILLQITVTPENVRAVVAALVRPAAYSMTVRNTLHAGGAGAVLSCRQTVRDGAVRIDYLTGAGGVERTTLFWQDACYAWKNGAVSFYKGVAGAFTGDTEAMLPTYETVCALEDDALVSAVLEERGGEPCIVVVAAQQEQTVTYVISASSGLLRRADYERDGETVRTVETDVQLETPEDSLFVLPGTAESIFAANT